MYFDLRSFIGFLSNSTSCQADKGKIRQVEKKAKFLRKQFEVFKHDIAGFLREMKPRLRSNLDPVAKLARLLQDYRQRFIKECAERRRLHNLLQELRLCS